MRLVNFVVFMALAIACFGQVNYTANDLVIPYEGGFRAGVNPGYHGGNWKSRHLADISAGNPASNTEGVGIRAFRGSLPEGIAMQYGYENWTSNYAYYAGVGLRDNTVFLGPASDAHRDQTEYCDGIPTDMFANLYEPIWDNGENGTPVNDENYYALYLYNVINAIGDHVKFWEVWNEPGFDFSGAHGWQPPGADGNWWENNPDPCDYKLRAPVFHYIRTLRISYEVIKTLSPDDYVVVSGLGYNSFLDVVLRNTDNPVDGSATSEYPHGGGAYFDVLGFHTYPHIDGSLRYWDNDIGGFVYTRHTDAAIAGLQENQDIRTDLLADYGYDGDTYPKKLWTITEINVPRKEYDNYFGSDEVQVNYILKMVVNAIERDITQTHVFALAEKEYYDAANDPFDVMGLYQRLRDIGPFEQIANQQGIAYKTASDLLYKTSFNTSRTNSLNLPDGIEGAAFRKPNGDYIYALWARTDTDNSEFAAASYSFPSWMGIDNLKKIEWDYSQTNNFSMVGESNIALTGRPVFFVPEDNQEIGELTLTNCPDPITSAGIHASEGGAIISWDEPTLSTTCPLGGATLELISDIPNGGLFPFGTSIVSYQGTDACGNETECAVTIEVGSTGGVSDDCNSYLWGFNYRGQYKGNKYFISLYDTTYAAAQAIAADYGGHLATISDADENDFIQSEIGDIAYIGLSDAASEGDMEWMDGSPVNYTNFDDCSWCLDNSSNNDFVQFHPWNGEWSFNDGSLKLFFVLELPCGENIEPCTDQDNDGVCADDDCNDNDASIPANPGTACNDGNSNTINDEIQSDGCTCAGEPDNGGDCDISYTIGNNGITVSGLNAPHIKMRVFNESWQSIYQCFDDCNNPQVINLPEGSYILDVLMMDDSWSKICVFNEPFEINGEGCFDQDADGVCADDDCDDNNPELPATPGSSCDDNNPATVNDVIQAGGCSCAGVPDDGDGDPCDIVPVVNGNTVTVTGMLAPNHIITVFDAGWQSVYDCVGNDCNNPTVVSGLANGVYHLSVKVYDDSWDLLCKVKVDFDVTNGEGLNGSGGERHEATPTDVLTSDIWVYPNPARDHLYVVLPENVAEDGMVLIYNQLGQLMPLNEHTALNTFLIRLDCSTLESGYYQVVVPAKDGSLMTKMFIKY